MPIFQLDEWEVKIPLWAWQKVRALMAYPKDDKKRQESLAAFALKLSQSAKKADAMALADFFKNKIFPQYGGSETLLGAPSEERMLRSRDGTLLGVMTAGDILLHVFLLDEENKDGSVNTAVDLLEQIYKAQVPRSRSSIMKAWSQFQSVAHLGTAYRLGCERALSQLSLSNLPEPMKSPVFREALNRSCIEELPTFLAIAEAFRCFGIQHISSHRREKKPLLDPEETWICQMPSPLPAVNLSGLTLTDHAKHIRQSYKANARFL